MNKKKTSQKERRSHHYPRSRIARELTSFLSSFSSEPKERLPIYLHDRIESLDGEFEAWRFEPDISINAQPRLFLTVDGSGFPEEFLFEEQESWTKSLIEGEIE